MPEADELRHQLLKRQNRDGGWGYQNASSWTEPTAFALLALEALSEQTPALERGRTWLTKNQRSDGGWGPNPQVGISTWVTSSAILAISGYAAAAGRHKRAIDWILGQIKPDLGPVERLEFWLQGMPSEEAVAGGTPWFPGTAAWVAPTSMTILALSQAFRHWHTPELERAMDRGCAYLLSRRCADGGWNHGSTRYRSPDMSSYPEVTGLALLALSRSRRHTDLGVSLDLAEHMMKSPESSEGQSWLSLGLLSHGRKPGNIDQPLRCHTTRDISLRLLAITASQGNNRLVAAGA